MRLQRLSAIVAVLLAVAGGAAAEQLASLSPTAVVQSVASAVTTGRSDGIRPWLTPRALADIVRLTTAERANHALAATGAPCAATLVGRAEEAGSTTLSFVMACNRGLTSWRLVFDDATGQIDAVDAGLSGTPATAAPSPSASTRHRPRFHAAHRRASHGFGEAEAPAPPTPAAPPPAPAPAPPPVAADARSDTAPAPAAEMTTAADRTVEFLLATTRKTDAQAGLRFTADRADGLTYGIVRVHVPEDHKAGLVERPYRLSLAGFTLYEEKVDEKKHFVVTGARLIGEDDFDRFATSDPAKTALVFVHGFNNTFEDSAYRFAQILYDLHYEHPAILFSWASKGSVTDYLYDKDSAEIARDRFAELIRTLRARGVERIEVIAHSMGNYLAVAALAASAETATPDVVDQLIMAAPDMARDYLVQEVPKLRRVAQGMTLYACATDRALQASKDVAGGVPRAGDVPSDGPVVIAGIDTIDMSALGADWFGLNHDVFASNRSVMTDIAALLNGQMHPPRLDAMSGMPSGTIPPRFWRFLAP